MKLQIVCPICDSEHTYTVSADQTTYNLKCLEYEKPEYRYKSWVKSMQTEFTSRMVTIRAKRSRASKKEHRRHFSIRVIDSSGKEDLIEFTSRMLDDFELRAKDKAVFSYVDSKPKVVQNLTVNRYMRVIDSALDMLNYLSRDQKAEE